MTIADYIQRDLTARIQSGRNPPGRLTLAGLSEHYEVSLSPVRVAVGGLIAEGYLKKQSNGRLAVNRQQIANHRATRSVRRPPPPTNWQEVITADVIELSLRGRTEYLREEATASRYGIGRTVIRQVFSRLAGKGLIEHVPRRGWRLRTFDEADMRAYLEVRESLELKALGLARPHLVPEDLQRMLAANTSGAGGKLPRLDNRLHRYLIEKSANAYILDFFDRHGIYYVTLFDYAAPEARVVRRMAAQHREILQALLDHNWSGARGALAHHIRSQQPAVRSLMEHLRV